MSERDHKAQATVTSSGSKTKGIDVVAYMGCPYGRSASSKGSKLTQRQNRIDQFDYEAALKMILYLC